MSAAIPLLELAESLPQNAPKPELPEPLECLEWEGRVDKWGLLYPGTWLDQPKWFMEDIRATESGKRRWQNEQVRQTRSAAEMPEVAPTVAR